MRPLNYSGSIVQDGGRFMLRTELTFNNKSDAILFGKLVHNFIDTKIAESGGPLKPVAPKRQVLVPGDMIFLPDKAVA